MFKTLDLYYESNNILTPGKDLILDESICTLKGRLSFKISFRLKEPGME